MRRITNISHYIGLGAVLVYLYFRFSTPCGSCTGGPENCPPCVTAEQSTIMLLGLIFGEAYLFIQSLKEAVGYES